MPTVCHPVGNTTLSHRSNCTSNILDQNVLVLVLSQQYIITKEKMTVQETCLLRYIV